MNTSVNVTGVPDRFGSLSLFALFPFRRVRPGFAVPRVLLLLKETICADTLTRYGRFC